MSILDKINSDSLSASRRLLIVVAIITICFLVISNLILKPKPPRLDSFSKTKKIEDIQNTLEWHKTHNPGALVTEDLICSARISTEENKQNISLTCPGLFLKKTTSLTQDQVAEVYKLIENNSDFWVDLDNEDTSAIKFYFSAFAFELKEIPAITATQGLLGEEIIAKVNFLLSAPSENVNLILEKIYSEKLASKAKESLLMPENLLIESTTTLRNNRYGYYLPIKPLIRLF